MPKTYPLYYYCRHGENDQKFILDRMYFIPDEQKEAVSDQYEKIYRSGVKEARRLANEYLHATALEHKNKRKKGDITHD